jgi:hypothetical protein
MSVEFSNIQSNHLAINEHLNSCLFSLCTDRSYQYICSSSFIQHHKNNYYELQSLLSQLELLIDSIQLTQRKWLDHCNHPLYREMVCRWILEESLDSPNSFFAMRTIHFFSNYIAYLAPFLCFITLNYCRSKPGSLFYSRNTAHRSNKQSSDESSHIPTNLKELLFQHQKSNIIHPNLFQTVKKMNDREKYTCFDSFLSFFYSIMEISIPNLNDRQMVLAKNNFTLSLSNTITNKVFLYMKSSVNAENADNHSFCLNWNIEFANLIPAIGMIKRSYNSFGSSSSKDKQLILDNQLFESIKVLMLQQESLFSLLLLYHSFSIYSNHKTKQQQQQQSTTSSSSSTFITDVSSTNSLQYKYHRHFTNLQNCMSSSQNKQITQNNGILGEKLNMNIVLFQQIQSIVGLYLNCKEVIKSTINDLVDYYLSIIQIPFVKNNLQVWFNSIISNEIHFLDSFILIKHRVYYDMILNNQDIFQNDMLKERFNEQNNVENELNLLFRHDNDITSQNLNNILNSSFSLNHNLQTTVTICYYLHVNALYTKTQHPLILSFTKFLSQQFKLALLGIRCSCC